MRFPSCLSSIGLPFAKGQATLPSQKDIIQNNKVSKESELVE